MPIALDPAFATIATTEFLLKCRDVLPVTAPTPAARTLTTAAIRCRQGLQRVTKVTLFTQRMLVMAVPIPL
jgi:hypothetical protein